MDETCVPQLVQTMVSAACFGRLPKTSSSWALAAGLGLRARRAEASSSSTSRTTEDAAAVPVVRVRVSAAAAVPVVYHTVHGTYGTTEAGKPPRRGASGQAALCLRHLQLAHVARTSVRRPGTYVSA